VSPLIYRRRPPRPSRACASAWIRERIGSSAAASVSHGGRVRLRASSSLLLCARRSTVLGARCCGADLKLVTRAESRSGTSQGPPTQGPALGQTPSPTPTDSAMSPSLAAPASSPSASCTRSGSSSRASSAVATSAGRYGPHRRFLLVSLDLVALVKLSREPDEAGGPPPSSSTDYGTCSRFQVAWRNRSQLRFLPHAGSATGRSCAAHTPAYRAAASSYTRCYLTDLGAGGAPDHRVRASMRALSRSRTAGFKSRPIRAIFSSVASARLARGGSGRSRRTCRGRARGAAGRRRSKVAPLRQSESGPRQTLPRRQPPPACRMSSSIMRR
jgi:hypothetical protein